MKQINQLLVTIVLLVLLGVGGYFITQQLKNRSAGKTREAVFLTNGQVYFGNIAKETGDQLVLRDIYYLQVQQPLQPAKDSKDQPQVSLVKLGNELHGPKDEMRIERQQILFREEMKSDSKVNQAINDYVKTGGATPTPSPAATK